MGQKYKVYVSNRPVIFSQFVNDSDFEGKSFERIISRGKNDILLIQEAIARGASCIWVECGNTEESWNTFVGNFEFIRAAGGVVLNKKNEILFIYRMSRWDLPKGKVEEGESIESAAVREVEEECSITSLEIIKLLYTTYHTYVQNEVPVLKQTSWYLMQYSGKETSVPQEIEGITDVRWISPSDKFMEEVRKNTYPSVIDVLRKHAEI